MRVLTTFSWFLALVLIGVGFTSQTVPSFKDYVPSGLVFYVAVFVTFVVILDVGIRFLNYTKLGLYNFGLFFKSLNKWIRQENAPYMMRLSTTMGISVALLLTLWVLLAPLF